MNTHKFLNCLLQVIPRRTITPYTQLSTHSHTHIQRCVDRKLSSPGSSGTCRHLQREMWMLSLHEDPCCTLQSTMHPLHLLKKHPRVVDRHTLSRCTPCHQALSWVQATKQVIKSSIETFTTASILF